MSQQPEEVLDGDEIHSEDDFHEEDGFGEDVQPGKLPFWKREILLGYSLPWILGGALLLAVGGWFIFGTSHGSDTNQPSDADFSEVEHTLGQPRTEDNHEAGPGMTSTDTPATLSASAPLPSAEGTREMMQDIRDELNEREGRINASITVLQDSISKLSEAIKRDEAYAVETRNQLMAVTAKLTELETRQQSTSATTVKASTAKLKTSSPIAGMHVVSLENGMAWIKWQGSTWAVREGDQLGKVTINRIDSTTRSISTTGGVLR